MSMHNGSYSDPAAQMATDANFDSFIESDLILDNEHANSEIINTPSKKKGVMGKSGKNKKVTPLSALPSKLSSANVERHTTPNTPSAAMNEFINFSQASDSTVTTPTTSNSSSLHNLSFDLYDGSDGAASIPGGNDVTSPEADMSNVATPSATGSNTHFFGIPHNADRAMSDIASMNAPMHNGLYGMHQMSDGVTPFQSFMGGPPMPPLQQRSVDDMGHQFGHQNNVHHHGHHQRSMSLRDMASTMQAGIQAFTPQALASFGYPGVEVKMEHEMSNGMPAYPMPVIPMADPTNVQGQDVIEDKPRCEKKRRLTNGSSVDSKDSAGKGAKGGNAKKAANNSRKRSNTSTSKGSTAKSKSEADQRLIQEENRQISANSLIESVPQVEVENESLSVAADTSVADVTSNEQSVEPEDDKPKKKTGTKRPPPSAFQITEAGMPFPVIDTSAKHSSLFVPPDTSGLTKREARLVKNRAAAFLSRQRKREQFEELEIKCRNLCRLVWLLYETGSGNFGNKNKNAFGSQDEFANFISQQEGEEVQEIFNTVLALKGGSIAPTEDGQLQGAVAAGIKSENGKIVGDASAVVHVPSSAAKAAEEASKELGRLRCELEEQQKREAALHAELAHERGLRLKMEFDMRQREEEMKPFRGGGQQDLSLTQPATFDDEDDNEDEEGDVTLKSDAHDSGRSGSNGKKKAGSSSSMRPSRTSRRIQGQSQNALTVQSQNANTAVGQRKAAGAALMMVLFSFALFGLPGGQTGRVGGISHAPGSSDLYPLGRVLGAPLSGSHLTAEEDEEGSENDRNGHLPPSSHLSVDDLFPTMHDIMSEAHQEKQTSGSKKSNFNFDYKSFAKDLESSLDWDMQRGFLVLGGDDEDSEAKEGSRQAGSRSPKSRNSMELDGQDSEADVKDAPTKLTLFVPAPDMSVNSEAGSVADASEDRFYDAPLADFDERSNGESVSEQQRELTQAEATRAALQVLRNHRVASEAAAFAASRRLGRQPSPSQRVGSPGVQHQNPASSSNKKVTKNAKAQGKKSSKTQSQLEENEDDEEEDFSNEVLEASSPATDRIRGTDFYQLEFSLSGAKVRNVAELARLLGSMRGGKGDASDHIKVA